MESFDSKDTDATPVDYGLSDTEKSLGEYESLLFFCQFQLFLNHKTVGIGNQAQCDSSSTFSGRGSEMESIFDPNYDSNSMLGACLALFFFFQCVNTSLTYFVDSI